MREHTTRCIQRLKLSLTRLPKDVVSLKAEPRRCETQILAYAHMQVYLILLF